MNKYLLALVKVQPDDPALLGHVNPVFLAPVEVREADVVADVDVGRSVRLPLLPGQLQEHLLQRLAAVHGQQDVR